MTPQDIITSVRDVIKDSDSAAYRYTDDLLRQCVVRAVRRISIIRPDLFMTIGSVLCAEAVLQTVPNHGRIIEVFNIVGGNAVREVSRELMDSLVPDWQQHAAGACVNWIRHARDPSQFFIYPKAPPAQSLSVQYTVAPSNYAIGDTIPLSDSYFPVVSDITVAEVEWADDEHMNANRAETFFNRGVQALGMSEQSKQRTDTETE